MGKYTISSVNYCDCDKEHLAHDATRCGWLDKPMRLSTKPGTLIRDRLVKPMELTCLNGLGYDGDVKGVDVDPDE